VLETCNGDTKLYIVFPARGWAPAGWKLYLVCCRVPCPESFLSHGLQSCRLCSAQLVPDKHYFAPVSHCPTWVQTWVQYCAAVVPMVRLHWLLDRSVGPVTVLHMAVHSVLIQAWTCPVHHDAPAAPLRVWLCVGCTKKSPWTSYIATCQPASQGCSGL